MYIGNTNVWPVRFSTEVKMISRWSVHVYAQRTAVSRRNLNVCYYIWNSIFHFALFCTNCSLSICTSNNVWASEAYKALQLHAVSLIKQFHPRISATFCRVSAHTQDGANLIVALIKQWQWDCPAAPNCWLDKPRRLQRWHRRRHGMKADALWSDTTMCRGVLDWCGDHRTGRHQWQLAVRSAPRD